MTAQEIIEKIRAEVLRLIRETDGPGSQYGFGKMSACNRILNFLDTIQEHPVCDGLEEEIERYLSTEWELDEDLNKDEPIYIYDCTWEDLKIFVRHFAQWGAEHLKK